MFHNEENSRFIKKAEANPSSWQDQLKAKYPITLCRSFDTSFLSNWRDEQIESPEHSTLKFAKGSPRSTLAVLFVFARGWFALQKWGEKLQQQAYDTWSWDGGFSVRSSETWLTSGIKDLNPPVSQLDLASVKHPTTTEFTFFPDVHGTMQYKSHPSSSGCVYVVSL